MDYYRTALEATYLTVDAVDWLQTRNIARNPTLYHEDNPFLGHRPDIGQVNSYFLAGAALHVGISYLLPESIRPWFQGIGILFESSMVYRNHLLGLSARF